VLVTVQAPAGSGSGTNGGSTAINAGSGKNRIVPK